MILTLLLYTLILFSKRKQDQGELLFNKRINSGWVDQDVVLLFAVSLIMIMKNHSNIPEKATCLCQNINFVITSVSKADNFCEVFLFALSCFLHNFIVYLFFFVMLFSIRKFLNVIIKYIFCFYPYTNVNQPNTGIASTSCLHLFL